jgi:CRP-like cAMP-binding protein
MLGFENNDNLPDTTGTQSPGNTLAKHFRQPLEAEPFRSFDAGTFLEGEVFSKRPIIIIAHGAIGLQHLLKDGRRTISTIFLSGEVLDIRHPSSKEGQLTSLTPVDVHLMKSDDFDRLQQKSCHFRSALLASHFRQCGLTACHCVDLARKSAVEKLASFIFECRKRQLADKEKTLSLILKRIDIADYMGLRPETLSRAFATLKKHKLIDCDGSDQIEILDEKTLTQIASGAVAQFG